ncbi:hypothetical protein QYM36_015096, partial [Artemia franciscana]
LSVKFEKKNESVPMEPEFRLKENGVSPEKLDDSSSQGSTAVLESSSSQDTPPVIRGPSLLESYSPKKKPEATRKPLNSIVPANDKLENSRAQVSMTDKLNMDELSKNDSSESFCDELREIVCGKPEKRELSSFDLCVSQAVPYESPEIVMTQDYNVDDKEDFTNKISDEGQHISADSSLNISEDKHVTSSFSTPDMQAQHHSTPHQSSELCDKENGLINSQDSNLEEHSFYFTHSSVTANKKDGSLHIQFIGEKKSDIQKCVSFLGSQVGIFLDNLIEKSSFHCPYSADISSSSKSKSSGSGNELLRAAISNSSKQFPNEANVNIPCLQLANSITSSEDSPFKQDQSTQVAFKDTPKSARKRTKSGCRRSSKNARSLSVIDENKDEDNIRGTKRKLETGSSSIPLQGAQSWEEEGGEKRVEDQIRKDDEFQSASYDFDTPLEIEDGRRQMSSKVGKNFNKAATPSKKHLKTAESLCLIKEEDAAETLGTKVASSDVIRISDEEFSVKANNSFQKVLSKSVELKPNLDVYSQYGRFYYPAKLGQHTKADKWEVNFLDGIKIEVGHVRVIPVQYIPKGTLVYCECHDARMKLPGIIVGYKSNGEVDYIVELDNGDVRIVPRMKVILSTEQMKLLLSEAPEIRTPCLDLDNVICGKRKRVQRMELQSPSTKCRAKKDAVLDGTESEVDRGVATPRRSAKKLIMEDIDKPQQKESKLLQPRISTPKQIFEGYGFLLTKKEVLSDIDDDMSDTERTFIMVDFNKTELRMMIQDRGGVVFDDFMSSQLHPKLQILVISNRACRTEKFVYALAAGFPPVHNAWVTDSIRRDSILAYTQYLLPSAIFESEIIEWKPRWKTLNGKKILIASDDVNFVQFWCSVLVVAGASKVTHFDKFLAVSPLEYDFIFGKMPEEQEESDKKLISILKNLMPNLPGVTNLWGIYCLANGLFELNHDEPHFTLW